MKEGEHFDWCVGGETKKFTVQAGEPFGVNGLDDFCSCGL